MKIYTKTGDAGKTGLIGGTRVSKSDMRLDAYGTVDELNAQVGYLISLLEEEDIKAFLSDIQHKLFVVGSHLATDQTKTQLKAASILNAEDIHKIELEIDRMDATLPPLKKFILPGGSHAAASSHICRAVSRRAERNMIYLLEEGLQIDAEILQYINRLSDYFFVLSRYINVNQGFKEIFWEQ